MRPLHHPFFSFFFFNDPAPTEIYTLSLHDALPISRARRSPRSMPGTSRAFGASGPPSGACIRSSTASCLQGSRRPRERDRKSTRLNSSHSQISYAVFCLKKKKKKINKTYKNINNKK